ncbi:MAG: FAD binding domain-containing protein [Candidatus Omnitrophica bacterium]|nr:FAD binding domain-containing protein [Candidatus Omnitrophota bacterium]
MLLNNFTYHSPVTLSELCKLCATINDYKIKAGGTFLLNHLKAWKKRGAKTPANIISLYKIPELKGIKKDKNEITIKAMTTLTEIAESSIVDKNLSALKVACSSIATSPIRNMATIGGNIASRFVWAELLAVMIAYDAKLKFIGRDKKTEIVGAEDFVDYKIGADKILTEIIIKIDPDAKVVYKRSTKFASVDKPFLALCANIRTDKKKIKKARIVVNNCISFPQRDNKLEGFLEGKELNSALFPKIAENMDYRLYDLKSDDYKKTLFRHIIKEAFRELKG